jgi:hypothetical protein
MSEWDERSEAVGHHFDNRVGDRPQPKEAFQWIEGFSMSDSAITHFFCRCLSNSSNGRILPVSVLISASI